MSYDLCRNAPAQKPYYIEAVGLYIYSIEELCFYLHENIYLLDQTIINERLCDWIRDELGMKRLYRQLYDQLEKGESIAAFILPIFREIGYLNASQMREYAEKIGKLDVQEDDMRQKLKADYLVRQGMFESARNEYWQILDRQGPGNLGQTFYAGVWNNLGCVHARMFRFEEAAECFHKAWELTQTKEMLRKYVSALPLFLSGEEYEKQLRELGADAQLIERIQEYNLKICEEARAESADEAAQAGQSALDRLEKLKKEYRRSARL